MKTVREIAHEILVRKPPEGPFLYRIKEISNLHRAAYRVIVKLPGKKVGRAFCSIILPHGDRNEIHIQR